MSEPPEADCSKCEKTKLRVDYLAKQYGFYTSHMNQVFNFYLVAAALIVTAFVQSLSGPHPIETAGSKGIALGGAALSIVFWLLHLRGFAVAGILETRLKTVEADIGTDFTNAREQSAPWLLKNTRLFSAIYILFTIGFLFAFYGAADLKERPAPTPAAETTVAPGNESAPSGPPTERVAPKASDGKSRYLIGASNA